jgi:transcription initiation factor TFIID TATA-box-binding protein
VFFQIDFNNEIFIKTIYILQGGKARRFMEDIRIENMVISVQLPKELLDVERLADTIPDAKYEPEEFPGLVLDFHDPKINVLLFPNGKMICTGAQNIKQADNAVQKTLEILDQAGVSIEKKPPLTTENIVASAELHKEIHLDTIAKNLARENVTYKPKRFPGLIYKMDDNRAVLLLFNSGKLVCTGLETVEGVTNAIDTIKNKLLAIGVL